MSTTALEPPLPPTTSAAMAWLRALQLTAPIAANPGRTITTVIREAAALTPHASAILSAHESLTYKDLAQRCDKYARWASARGLSKGDVVGLLMENRPDYFSLWAGLSSIGCIVALLNTHLEGASLAHCIQTAHPRMVIASSSCFNSLESALPHLRGLPDIWAFGETPHSLPRLDLAIAEMPSTDASEPITSGPSIEDTALYIYTSGSTGLPKAVVINHARIMQWSHWFAGLTQMQSSDRIYNCLPMYHSIGGVLVPGAAIAGGASVFLRERFSTTEFWSDIRTWQCTVFQYIGELCRYLLHSSSIEGAEGTSLRLACGNGMSADVWTRFQEQFHIPQILEFYASTEGAVSLFNAEGKPGAIGRVPPYLAHRFSPRLVKFDPMTEQPVRDENGFCIPCGPNEPGEALGKFSTDDSSIAIRFTGYTDNEASQRKILHNVFREGDAWIRTGDLMRKDEAGFYYFVDRIGDTFRWKGENISSTEVAEAIASFPKVKFAMVYGVGLPFHEGRAGMAAIVTETDFDLSALQNFVHSCLPSYACPLFWRLQSQTQTTGTFKYAKSDLVTQGCNPTGCEDALYFDDRETGELVPVDQALYDRLQSGSVRL